MANLETSISTVVSFSEFPEDVQLCILSFLTPSEISSFACTSKQFLSVCRNDSKLWFSMCDRRWGSKTQIKKWGSGMISFKHLYKTLHEYENLIGFWRISCSSSQSQSQSPNAIPPNQPPALVLFEWGPSFITGSRVSPSNTGVSYNVVKAPFLWMGISTKGEIVNFLAPNGNNNNNNSQLKLDDLLISCVGNDLVSVDVNHMGEFHIVIEERVSFGNSPSPPPPDRITSELYQYFANRTSPGGERAWRRQRRRERERQGNNNNNNKKKKWDIQHFVKIVNYSPTTLRPLQGLWKGICQDANLDFYLVTYDDIGGIACRRIGGDSSYAPVFWTSNTTFFESPFSSEEEYIYDTRQHLHPPEGHGHLCCYSEKVSRILLINSSYDLVIPGLATVNPHQVEGRIWQYGDGTFGFGFLRDNHIIDLKHIAVDGCLLDATPESL